MPDATSFTLELAQPYSCALGECATTTITSGSGALDGGVMTIQLQGARDSRSGGDCEEGHFGYERTFLGRRFHWNGG